MNAHLLFVEDDATFRDLLEREMRSFGCKVTSSPSAEAAQVLLSTGKFDLALLDLNLPGQSGLEFLPEMKRLDPEMPVIFLTGHGNFHDAVEATRAGAFDFLGKPVPLDELQFSLERAHRHGTLERRNRRLKGLIQRGVPQAMVGDSGAMRALNESLPPVAESDANLLLLGESGTGKELLARVLHEMGPRREAAFVEVRCAGVPPEAFKGELLGHPTPSDGGVPDLSLGLVELAEGGTLFLDEVVDLTLDNQLLLLRLLEDNSFQSTGGGSGQSLDIRLVASSARDLTLATEKGEFREDLYHRLATLVLHVPPLRQRLGDVQRLADAILVRHNREAPAQEQRKLSEEAVELLKQQRWPGNVRELQNVLMRGLTLCENEVMTAEDIREYLGSLPHPSEVELPSLDLDVLERLALVQAMRKFEGNRRRVAAQLGVATKTLYNKILQHRISPEEWDGS